MTWTVARSPLVQVSYTPLPLRSWPWAWCIPCLCEHIVPHSDAIRWTFNTAWLGLVYSLKSLDYNVFMRFRFNTNNNNNNNNSCLPTTAASVSSQASPILYRSFSTPLSSSCLPSWVRLPSWNSGASRYMPVVGCAGDPFVFYNRAVCDQAVQFGTRKSWEVNRHWHTAHHLGIISMVALAHCTAPWHHIYGCAVSSGIWLTAVER